MTDSDIEFHPIGIMTKHAITGLIVLALMLCSAALGFMFALGLKLYNVRPM